MEVEGSQDTTQYTSCTRLACIKKVLVGKDPQEMPLRVGTQAECRMNKEEPGVSVRLGVCIP